MGHEKVSFINFGIKIVVVVVVVCFKMFVYLAMNFWRNEKQKRIKSAIQNSKFDQSDLYELCRTQGGLLDNQTRQQVWPKIISPHLDTVNIHTTSFDTSYDLEKINQSDFDRIFKDYSEHRDFKIVKMDVRRSGARMPKNMSEHDTLKWQGHTIQLIMNVLHYGTHLYYYQGYHDVALTILLCVGYCPFATAFLLFVSENLLVDFMYRDMSRTSHILKFLIGIVAQSDPPVGGFLVRSGVGEIFCLSWLITWFSHSLDELGLLLRLFDLFLVSHPFLPLYLTAAIVLERRNELLLVECEMAQVHQFLSHVPKDICYEKIIRKALVLFNVHPPSRLSRINRIPLTPFLSNKRHTRIFVTGRFSSKRILNFLKSKDIYIPITLSVSIVVVSVVMSASLFVLNYFEIIDL